jgi:hypothetical protein
MLIKLKHIGTLVESLKHRLILEGLKDDIKNSLITLVGLEESNNIFNQLTISNSRLNQLVSQDPNSYKDSRLAELIKDSKKFDGEHFIINLRDNGLKAIEDFKKWSHKLLSIPSGRDLRSHLVSYAKFGTIKKELKNSQGEKFNLFFKLTPAASIKLARDLGGSKMCTTSDKSCKNFDLYSKNEYAGKNPEITVLVTFQPIDESLIKKAIKMKHETHGHELEYPEVKLEDFERAYSIQAVLKMGLIQKKQAPPALHYDEIGIQNFEDPNESGYEKLYTIPQNSSYDDIGWYDDLMFSTEKGKDALKKLYDLEPSSISQLLNHEDLSKILHFKLTRTGAKLPDKTDRTPMEKWIESFPGKKVTNLPPAGFPLDDVRPGFGSWSFSGVEFNISDSENYNGLNFENCVFKLPGGKFEIKFEDCNIDHCTFDNLRAIEITNCHVEDCSFKNLKEYLLISNSLIKDSSFKDCFITDLGSIDTEMVNLNFDNCGINSFSPDNNTKMINIEFSSCAIVSMTLDADNIKVLEDVRFYDGAIADLRIFDANLSEIEMTNVKINMAGVVANNNYGTIVINDQAYNQSVITNKLALIYKK